MLRVCCGVPANECTGGVVTMNSGWRGFGLDKSAKVHTDSTEAFKCYAAHLERNGFTRIGPREFAAPNDGPVRLLTKKSRFGSKLRRGKTADGNATKKRFVPSKVKGARPGAVL